MQLKAFFADFGFLQFPGLLAEDVSPDDLQARLDAEARSLGHCGCGCAAWTRRPASASR